MLNERENLPLLIGELERSLSASCAWEIVLVDDGSTDGTLDAARELLKKTGFSWQLLRLSRNFGHQAAYSAGLHAASGEAVIMMDADLQDPPEVIPDLVAAWQKGARLVTAVRLSRAETGWRKLCFHLFHVVFHRLTGGLMPKNSGNFGLMDRVVIDKLKQLPERNLFLPALRAWIGFSHAEVHYHRRPRAKGPARMNWNRLASLAFDGITSFSSVPLRLVGWLGFAIAAIAFLYASALVLVRFLQFFGYFAGVEQLGFTTVATAVLGLGGLQLLGLGLFGEYLGRVYLETKQRPVFIVESVETSEFRPQKEHP